MKIRKVVVITNQSKPHAKQTAAALKAVLDLECVRQQWVETLPPQRNRYRRLADLRNLKPDLVIVCGDQLGSEGGLGRTGTMLAIYLISQGDAAEAAIRRIRGVELSAIETSRQIQFLEEFASH